MKNGLISKIQRYSTKDGPGLRTTVFFMGCNLRCLWCANPENLEYKKRVFYFKKRCQKCGLCIQNAHNNSIVSDQEGCQINRKLCDNILDMVDICPYNAYEQIGIEISVDKLVEKLKRDYDFYKTGKGGVTFSGGEATLQSDFIYEVSQRLKQEGIHTCLDTAGEVSEDTLKHLLKNIDMVLYDIKAIDDDIHKKCTGISNQRILANAKVISKLNIPMIIRLIIVPKHNDDINDMKKRIDFICSLGQSVKQVDILKYHIYGIGKYESLSEDYPILGSLVSDEEKIQSLYQYALSKGLHVTIDG